MKRLQDKVAIVTGAASGIGAATVELFVRMGARVVATDLQVEKLKLLGERLRPEGFVLEAFRQDVSDEGQWQDLVDTVEERFGRIDILVNDAGVAGHLEPIELTGLETWQKTIDVNLKGSFLGMRAVIPVMKRSGGGSIVNVSSIAGITGMGGGNPYTASKGGLRLLSKGVALQSARDGIRVNSVEPGYILTPMLEQAVDRAVLREEVPASVPMGRIGRPEEIARAIAFLASDEASYITGADLIVDGGYTAR